MKKVHNKDILKQHNVNIQYERSLEGQYAKIFIITTLKEGGLKLSHLNTQIV
jgi:hypothetical protein